MKESHVRLMVIMAGTSEAELSRPFNIVEEYATAAAPSSMPSGFATETFVVNTSFLNVIESVGI